MKAQVLVSLWLALATSVSARNPDNLKKDHDVVFTPKDMLALPRPAPVVVAPDGRLGLSVLSQHSFETRKTTASLHVIRLNETSGPEPVLALESVPGRFSFSDPVWLSEYTFAYINRTNADVAVWSRDLHHTGHHGLALAEPRHLLDFPTGSSPSSLKFLSDKKSASKASSGVLAFSAHVWLGHDIEDTQRLEEEYANRGDDAMIWDELFIREWDAWRNPDKVHQIFLAHIPASGAEAAKAKKPVFHSPFNASGIWSLMQPFETSDYDLTWDHAHHGGRRVRLAVQIKDKHLNYAFNSRRQIYLTSVHSPSSGGNGFASDGDVQMVTSGEHGDVSAITFNPNGTILSWLQREENGAESARSRLVTYDLGLQTRTVWTETWDRSPSAIAWAKNSESIYLLAEDQGSTLPYHLTHPGHLPTPLLFNGTTSSITPLGDSRFLLGISTLTHPTENYILELHAPKHQDGDTDGDKLPFSNLTSLTHWSDPGLAHVNLAKGEKFWFKGAQGRDVMGWFLPPRGYKKGSHKKWPLAFLIHGGPEGAWEDSWSTRWNLNVFAQQGYAVVAINPTGSTGYGQDFVEAIYQNWGGSPYKDLVAGLQYILGEHPEIDPDRLTALGASYGGYMINWLQGHNELTNFKAFVCHDGLFETHMMYYMTEQVYFPQRENGGLPPWQTRAPYEKWSPNNFVHEWSTPALIIHGGKDFRVPDTQGISAFTALQSRGIPSRFLYFKDENHWVLDPQNSLRWHQEVFRWLDEWVGHANEDYALSLQIQ